MDTDLISQRQFYEFGIKEGAIETPFVHKSFENNDENYRQYFLFGFTHNMNRNRLTNLVKFPADIIEEDLEEYISQRASSYEIKCYQDSIFVGEYVLPARCAFFRLHMKKMTRIEGEITVFRNFSGFPVETVKLYIDGIHSIPLELGISAAVQLIDFLIYDGKAEMYSLPRNVLKSCCNIITSRKVFMNFGDGIGDIDINSCYQRWYTSSLWSSFCCHMSYSREMTIGNTHSTLGLSNPFIVD